MKSAVAYPRCNPTVVERMDDVKDGEEMYPMEPNPVTVEFKLGVDKKPAVLNSVLNPPVVDKRLV